MRLRGASTDAYTLIELLIVMAILALVATVATPVTSRMVRAANVRSDTYRVVTELRQLQDTAVRMQRTITIAPTTSKLETSAGRPIALSETTTVEVTAPIVFYADGTTTGGHLSLHGGGLESDVQIAWLTGAITVGGSP